MRGSVLAALPCVALRYLGAVPLSRVDGVHAKDVHSVNFLEATVLGLDHEEVDDEDEGCTAPSEYKAVPVVNSISNEPRANLSESVDILNYKRKVLGLECEGPYKNEIMKFQNQLLAVARAMHGAL